MTSTNALHDWHLTAKPNETFCYHIYDATAKEPQMLCRVRDRYKDLHSGRQAEDAEIVAMADMAWGYAEKGSATLAQQRADGLVRYLAIKRPDGAKPVVVATVKKRGLK